MLLIFIYMLYKNILVVGWRADLGIKTAKSALYKCFALYIFKRKRIKNLTTGSHERISRNSGKNQPKSVPFYGRKTRRNSQRVHFRLIYSLYAT